LPGTNAQGYFEHDGAHIWYSTYGSGPPVIMLHGGLGHSGYWGYQIPALVNAGCRAVLIDSRGHGRSTRDSRPLTYELMASVVLAVMDELHLDQSARSDGACTALILAMNSPTRVAGVFFFACNMDPSGVKDMVEPNSIVNRCFRRHAEAYARLSGTPDQFEAFAEAVGLMQRTQPNSSAQELAEIRLPMAIVQSELDEFTKREHAEYLARSIPGAQLIVLSDVSHFAPLQREMRIIRDDLHSNAVRVTDGDADRLEVAAQRAAEAGLEVWWSPLTCDLTTKELRRASSPARSSSRVAGLRRRGPVDIRSCPMR
jgi:pimeloyl-ACP methyl ester carboxylesterase